MKACICYLCSCVAISECEMARDGAILQHQYVVGYNGYIQTDVAQNSNVYLFFVLTVTLLFFLVVLHPS